MTPPLRAVGVFCGSNLGGDPAFAEAAARLGRLLAERGLTLVYGGARIGLMGVIADAALGAGGEVHGVIPTGLVDKELAHTGLTRLDVVTTMHERKARMAELSDGFIALPGGAGTLDEMAEIWTWAQLGLHQKPIGFLNVGGYFNHLLAFIDHAVANALVKRENAEMLLCDSDPAALLDAFTTYAPVHVDKWIGRDQT